MDNWCAQEKFDGKRVQLRKSGAEIVAANRNGLSIGFPDTLTAQLSRVSGDFTIDGESVGETFYAFDLLEDARGDWRHASYRDRLEALQAQFGKLGRNIVVATTAMGKSKRTFLADLKAAAKRASCSRTCGRPGQRDGPPAGAAPFKCKFWATCSCVVTKVNARRSVEIALSGRSVGNVTIPPNHDIPAIGQVVEIRYLYVTGPGGSLYQPVYLGVRDDVRAEDCTVERQRLKFKPLEEQAA